MLKFIFKDSLVDEENELGIDNVSKNKINYSLDEISYKENGEYNDDYGYFIDLEKKYQYNKKTTPKPRPKTTAIDIKEEPKEILFVFFTAVIVFINKRLFSFS